MNNNSEQKTRRKKFNTQFKDQYLERGGKALPINPYFYLKFSLGLKLNWLVF